MTFVNVYFPCISKRNDIFIVTDILDEIREKLANIVYTHLIFGGILTVVQVLKVKHGLFCVLNCLF